ncbi:eosinophil granule major basic protein 1-like isoform X4 [Poecile atricapillus]|uniref:eosinophil granule major basic protein 1-like isoform X4 n=1 Tax=Poecile atricapillus TaxID=48891 RepID=UPI0027399A33|nr:eosinophil granule major basic protein 1-like isoform X4 [Poecile atricapillus]
MWPCLLLALALLGTVAASYPAEGPLVPVLCPAAPRQLQGVPAGETPPLYYTVVKKLRTYAQAQRYCQDVYRGQLASVHSASRNQELHKLARTYKILISPWIGAVTSKRVKGQRGQGATKGVLGAGETSWGLLWGVRDWGAGCWGCILGDEPGHCILGLEAGFGGMRGWVLAAGAGFWG